MRLTAIISFLIILSLSGPRSVEAAKKFVSKGTTTVRTGRSSGGCLPVAVRYRPDKRALNFSFSNFSGISSVSYVFQYETSGISQGAAGSITALNSPGQSRELLFGTCSTSVCTYHAGLKNAKLTFTANYSNGRTASKVYRVKTYF